MNKIKNSIKKESNIWVYILLLIGTVIGSILFFISSNVMMVGYGIISGLLIGILVDKIKK